MKINFQASFALILKSEGGFSNHPSDPGGMTNLGVTKRVWEEWVGHEVTEQDMRNLTPAIIAPMYKAKYWDKVCGDDLPSGVDYVVFDAAINSGPGRAIKWLQACVKVDVDGQIGPHTLNAVTAFSDVDLISDYNKRRLSFLIDLPTWPTFGKGWTNRVAHVGDSAVQMVTA